MYTFYTTFFYLSLLIKIATFLYNEKGVLVNAAIPPTDVYIPSERMPVANFAIGDSSQHAGTCCELLLKLVYSLSMTVLQSPQFVFAQKGDFLSIKFLHVPSCKNL